MRSSEESVGRLVAAFPALRAELERHLADQDGELLEYIFLADVERWAENTLEADPSQVSAVLSWLDQEYARGDSQLQEWIAGGFVEVLPEPGEPAAALRSMLGPHLTELADEIG